MNFKNVITLTSEDSLPGVRIPPPRILIQWNKLMTARVDRACHSGVITRLPSITILLLEEMMVAVSSHRTINLGAPVPLRGIITQALPWMMEPASFRHLAAFTPMLRCVDRYLLGIL